tara:strand:- start:232 stop:1107 length:876 start_codon:yes stop_codon:yes gene_type:complete
MKKIILGTVQFGLDYGINNNLGKPSFNDFCKILNFAYSNGIKFLDSAESYGNCHERIGKYHFTYPLNKFNIITKFSPDREDLPKNMVERVKKNIEILKVKNLYCYMFHSFFDFNSLFSKYKDELLLLKKNKLIKKIGVSIHSNHEINEVLKYKEIDLIQVPYNLLDNIKKRNKTFLKAKEMGIEIHTRSVFLQGLFFKEINSLRGNMRVFKKYLQNLNNIILDNNMDDVALNYAFDNKSIDAVLFGVDNLNHLRTNLKSLLIKNGLDNIFSKINEINFEEESMLNPVNWTK